MLTEPRYRCPGEGYDIGRAEHLARLTDGYARCDGCPHRAELSHLPASAARRLAVRPQARSSLVADEGVGGVAFNEFAPHDAERWCRAFGQLAVASETTARDAPTIALAHDGRPVAPEFLAAAAQGLRWAGCEVLELPAATSATLDWARRQRQAVGSVLVGNPHAQAQTCGLRFWLSDGAAVHPWSSPGSLQQLAAMAASSLLRPRRRAPVALRGPGDAEYLAALRPLYHGLRPLRFMCESVSRPFLGLLESLLAPTGCQWLRPASAAENLHFHFAAGVDGEACRVWDETGREAAPAAVAVLLARRLLAQSTGATVVLGEDLAAEATRVIVAAGGDVVTAAPHREAISRRLTETDAALGATQGYVWFAGCAAPDALAVLSQLLSILSESDAPLSTRLRG